MAGSVSRKLQGLYHINTGSNVEEIWIKNHQINNLMTVFSQDEEWAHSALISWCQTLLYDVKHTLHLFKTGSDKPHTSHAT